MSNRLFSVARPDGIAFSLLKKALLGRENALPVAEWSHSATPELLTGVGILNAWVANNEASAEENAVVVPHALVASLPHDLAKRLSLSEPPPFLLNIEHEGTFDREDFRFRLTWLLLNQQPVFGATRIGTFLHHAGKTYRITDPLFSLIEASEIFNLSTRGSLDDRLLAWAKLRGLLPPETEQSIQLTGYLRNTRVAHAARFSLDISSGINGFTFEPVLFGPETHKVDFDEMPDEAILDLPGEEESILPPALHRKFTGNRFREAAECKAQYALGDGWYVVLDGAVRDALTVVRKAQMADAATRREFVKHPNAFLAAALGEKYDASLFVETQEYSTRVQDVGLWQPISVPWIKRKSEPWLPETFGLKIGSSYVQIEPSEIDDLRTRAEEAIRDGKSTIDHNGQVLPASESMLESLDQLSGFAKPKFPNGPSEPLAALEKDGHDGGLLVLDLGDNSNLFDKTFSIRRISRAALDKNVPAILKSTLKPHQLLGLDWLQQAWIGGEPGVLLADDMGLGKTVQTLAFLAWIRTAMRDGRIRRKPILIVAPTGLLANWKQEHVRHLADPGLGEVLEAYGAGIKALRISGTKRGNDTNIGEALLDKQRISTASWVLTTYETMRDYQLSFGAVPFAVVVFDEMQKIKTPGTAMTNAAKALNSNFTLGLTGTPIENRLADLWQLIDTLQPGLLVGLKEFSAIYETEEDHEKLKELKNSLEKGDTGRGVMLRRMKADLTDGLPKRHADFLSPISMPDLQAHAYDDAIREAKVTKGDGAMLKALHRMRSVSLHPIHPETAADDRFINMSARLAGTMTILDKIRANDEKALIFLESLDFQATLAELIKRRFRLKRAPFIISGEVAGQIRQRKVDEFQNEQGWPRFDVMILSPRAGGVGLTLTAANHVIHLSRWWNPAVEDQCTDRVYRIGQTREVHVYYPQAIHPAHAEKSFDVRLHNLLERKRQLSREMLLPPMNASDTQTLFEETLEAGGEALSYPFDLGSIDEMEPLQFENWVLRQLKDSGYRVSRTLRSHDCGADGIAIHQETGRRIIIQCKHTQGSELCTERAITDLLRARFAYDAANDILLAVTNARGFTAGALDMASRERIVTISRNELLSLPYLAAV